MVSCGPLLPEGGTAFCFRQQNPMCLPRLWLIIRITPGKVNSVLRASGAPARGRPGVSKQKKLTFHKLSIYYGISRRNRGYDSPKEILHSRAFARFRQKTPSFRCYNRQKVRAPGSTPPHTGKRACRGEKACIRKRFMQNYRKSRGKTTRRINFS